MMYLTDDTLGTLDLECFNDFVVSSFQVGWPAVREVMYPRALTDGVVDTTTYLGARAVTVSLRFKDTTCTAQTTQAMLDVLSPYLSPRNRPTLVWSVREPVTAPTDVRSLMIRGVDAPLVVENNKYLTIVCQWVAQESFTSGIDETCAVAPLTFTGELGRVYDLDFDRDYPASPPIGVTDLYTNGNAPMDWTGTITDTVTDPSVFINGIEVAFTGVSLVAGQTININTRDRTMLVNNDPTQSVYGSANYTDWSWDDLLLRPGLNQIRLEAVTSSGSPAFTLCWFDRWYM